MVASALDKPLYTPQFPPPVVDTENQQVETWVKQELDTIARMLTAQPGTLYTPNNVVPARPRTGMLTYADGTNWNPGYGEGLYVYKQGVWVPVGVGAGSRIRLLTDTTFWLDPAGNDSNPGTNAAPWLTTAPLYQRYDSGGRTVTLSVKNNLSSTVSLLGMTGGGNLILDVQSKSITTTNGPCVAIGPGSLPGTVTVQNTGVLSASGTPLASAIQHKGGGKLLLSNINFGACTFAGLWLSGSGGGSPEVSFIGSATNTLSGNSQFLFFLAAFCTIVLGADSANQPVKFATSGARTFSGAVLSVNLCFADLTAATWDYSGGALTGTRIVNTQSVVAGSIP